MKQLHVILISGFVLVLAGCGSQGGSKDQYNTGSGAASNTDDPVGKTNDYQGGASSPSGANTGTGYSTNYPKLGTNGQGGATNSGVLGDGSQPIDAKRTNNVPEN